MNTYVQESDVLMDQDICCTEFEPALWQNKKFVWTNKLFLKDSIPELFHIPLPGAYGRAITRMWEKATKAGAAPERKDFFLMAHDPSPFKGELYMAITKEIAGEDNVKLSGTYMSKVFDGPYHHVPKFMAWMDGHLASIKMKARKYYFSFAYCPKCSKKYGHNYIVAIAEV
jgi:hypothetical protein